MEAKRRPSRLGRASTGSHSTKIGRLIADNQLRAVFQPIVDVATGKVFAYEALARTTAPEFKPTRNV
jgi:EAL domain-containing protein (putative c-di-GMP-specific phosphodiesterase class I)